MINGEEIHAFLDGMPVELESLLVFPQRNPYPGDHYIKLEIEKPNLRKNYRDLVVGNYSEIEEGLNETVLWYLQRAQKRQNLPERIATYLINRVNKLSVTEEQIVIEAICSSVILCPRPN